MHVFLAKKGSECRLRKRDEPGARPLVIPEKTYMEKNMKSIITQPVLKKHIQEALKYCRKPMVGTGADHITV